MYVYGNIEAKIAMMEIDAELQSITKKAGFGTSILSGIENWAKSAFDVSSVGGFLESMEKLLIAGALFRMHPVLGIIAALAEEFGIDLAGYVNKMFKIVKDALTGKFKTSPEDLLSIVSTAAISESKGMVKNAFGRRHSNTAGISDFVMSLPEEMKNAFEDVLTLSSKNPTRAGGIISRVAFFAVRGVFVGAILGLIAHLGKEAITSAMGGGKDKEPKNDDKPEQPVGNYEYGQSAPAVTKYHITPSGWGEKEHNQPGYIWEVDIKTNASNLLKEWCISVYPDLATDRTLTKSTSFSKMVSLLSGNEKDGWITIPREFRTVKQIVDKALGI